MAEKSIDQRWKEIREEQARKKGITIEEYDKNRPFYRKLKV